MTRRLKLAAPILASLVCASLCGGCLERKVSERAGGSPSSATPAPPSPGARLIADAGDFRVEYGAARARGEAELRQDLRENRVLEGLADELNKALALPADVTLAFDECGKADATYDAGARRVSVCYELVDSLYDAFRDAKSDDERDDKVVGATVFVFQHELAHLLAQIYKLPAADEAEGAADELALFLLTREAGDADDAALDAAEALTRDESPGAGGEEVFLRGAHALDRRRQSDLLCWLYARDGEKYKFLIEDGELPAERAERCGGEFAQVERDWAERLKPYLKT
ncbi:MAG: DUF4344 domain-containing metallopeptidase [Pyrinomonadaceae bacterium]